MTKKTKIKIIICIIPVILWVLCFVLIIDNEKNVNMLHSKYIDISALSYAEKQCIIDEKDVSICNKVYVSYVSTGDEWMGNAAWIVYTKIINYDNIYSSITVQKQNGKYAVVDYLKNGYWTKNDK